MLAASAAQTVTPGFDARDLVVGGLVYLAVLVLTGPVPQPNREG